MDFLARSLNLAALQLCREPLMTCGGLLQPDLRQGPCFHRTNLLGQYFQRICRSGRGILHGGLIRLSCLLRNLGQQAHLAK